MCVCACVCVCVCVCKVCVSVCVWNSASACGLDTLWRGGGGGPLNLAKFRHTTGPRCGDHRHAISLHVLGLVGVQL